MTLYIDDYWGSDVLSPFLYLFNGIISKKVILNMSKIKTILKELFGLLSIEVGAIVLVVFAVILLKMVRFLLDVLQISSSLIVGVSYVIALSILGVLASYFTINKLRDNRTKDTSLSK